MLGNLFLIDQRTIFSQNQDREKREQQNLNNKNFYVLHPGTLRSANQALSLHNPLCFKCLLIMVHEIIRYTSNYGFYVNALQFYKVITVVIADNCQESGCHISSDKALIVKLSCFIQHSLVFAFSFLLLFVIEQRNIFSKFPASVCLFKLKLRRS